MKILVSTTLRWPIERQIPKAWRDAGISVHINEPLEECDIWVVYQGLRRPQTVSVPQNRVFLFTYEPPGLHAYHPGFLNQFAKVVSCQNLPLDSDRLVQRHQAQPWLAGIKRHASENIHVGFDVRYTIDDFRTMSPPEKDRRISAICSTKVMVPGHQARLDFVRELKKRLGDELEVFGYGFKPIEDKWDALAPYQYHLVLENNCIPHYWSEKLADAYLGFCFPIVWGCSNLGEYFNKKSFLTVDSQNISASVEKVCNFIHRHPVESQKQCVQESRDCLIENYSLFAEILRLAIANPPEPSQRVLIKDEGLFGPLGIGKIAVRWTSDRWRLRK